MNGVSIIHSSYNFKYIGRYQLALTAPTEHIIILDDDRFPKENYCKRITEILSEENCIVNQSGWIDRLSKDRKFIQPGKNNQPGALIKVDFLCGGMAFRKRSLQNLFKESIPTTETGEDIMMCLRAKKHNIPVLAYSPATKDEMLVHDNEGVTSTETDEKMLEIRMKLIKNETISN